jgi:dipeptidyl aminopeptidase/acylaminoacyl peptidase
MPSSRLLTPALFACVLAGPAQIHAQSSVTRADYERALGLRERWEHLTTNVADNVAWLPGTQRFVYRRSVIGGHEFIVYDVVTREKRPAFDHERLAQALAAATGTTQATRRLPFTSFRFTDDESAVIVTIDGRSWSCTLGDHECTLRQPPRFGGRPTGFGVVRDLEAPFDSSARRSPDGRWEAMVRNHNVVVQRAGGGNPRVLTSDGVASGFFDHATITWSPDSRRIALYHVTPGERRIVHFINASPSHQLQPVHFTRLYPKPGDVIDRERPVIFDVESGGRVDVAADLFPNPYRLTNLAWRQDGSRLTFEYNERGHKRYRVIEVDAAMGNARAVIDEEAETFFNYPAATGELRGSGTYWRHDIDDGREILWMSERDGRRHVYLYDGATGRVKNQVTRGEYVLRGVLHVDEAARRLWFIAGGMNPDQDPYFGHVYRIDFDGSNLVPLTTENAHHEVVFSPDMQHYLVSRSRVDLPTILELRRTADNALVELIERGDITALETDGWLAPEVFTAKGRDGETDIWGIIVRPSNFDPSRGYPVIENIYNGPHGSFVPKGFMPFLPHSGGDGIIGMQAQAELGFIVVMIDGMGTANRTKAFHDVMWRNLADGGFPDRIAWHRAVAERYPYYDVTRVGIYGASAGGQAAMAAVLGHPDVYRAAVAYNGCHDNRMDKISWNELWMGWPIGEQYDRSSNVVNAHRLEGDLLLIVGMLDTNVDPTSTLQVVDALTRAGKTYDLIVVPDDGHATGRTTGPVEYVTRAQYDFFVRTLQGGQPPHWNAEAPE